MKLDISENEKFSEALEQLEKGQQQLFITGRAGTGKSTLLRYFREKTTKNIIVLAPTGVAALNVQGQTIHSFFGFPPQITPEQAKKEHPFPKTKPIIQKLDLIVIDEASMLRADLLDCIDQALRQYGNKSKPFGGFRMIFVGDLYQLPPVVTREEKESFQEEYASPYFFDAKVFGETGLQIIELEKIYRQNEASFIRILNAIRDNSITPELLDQLNELHDQHYEAFHKASEITLCTTNTAANDINIEQLNKIKGKTISFSSNTEGDFQRQLPTEKKLQLKAGAQIMLVNNDPARRWVNGSMGTITGIEWDEEEACDALLVTLSDGKKVEVFPYTWEANHYYFDDSSNSIEMECVGSFSQYPVRLAWAVTIHKSQGKSFDHVVVDIGYGTFAHGQIYVALSRCTSLEGLILRQPIQKKHVWSDFRVNHFLNDQQAISSSEKQPSALEKPVRRSLTFPEKKKILENAIDNESNLELKYVKGNGEIIQKTIRPVWIGEMEYAGNEYMGVEALGVENGETMVLSLKRIMGLENQ